MIVVSDSTPLIHLAKVGNIKLLFSLYKEVLITKEVYREVVEEGIILEKDDAGVIQEYTGKSIHVKSPMSSSDKLVKNIESIRAKQIQFSLQRRLAPNLFLLTKGMGGTQLKMRDLESRAA